jgi:hypothetical protein
MSRTSGWWWRRSDRQPGPGTSLGGSIGPSARTARCACCRSRCAPATCLATSAPCSARTFFDALELPDGAVATLIGDVTGHGPAEAAVGVALRAAWRALILAGHGPGDVLDRLDRVLVSNRTSEEIFATVCCLWVSPDRRRVVVGLAGHPPPLLVDDGKIGFVNVAGGPALGILEESYYVWQAGALEVATRGRCCPTPTG